LDFPKVIDLLTEFFEREKLPFAVIGAFGLHAYGLTRATTDLDFVTDSAVQPRVVAFLERSGYETLYVSPGYSNHLHLDADLGRVDLVYVSGETSRRLFAESKPLRIAGRVLLVPRPEFLAAMKVHAMRNDPERRHQELADIRFLLGLPNGIERRFGHTSRRAGWESSTTNSKKRSDLLDLERDLPTTPDDVAAQRRLKARQWPGSEQYLRFLASFDPVSPEELRRKEGPRGDSPFELIPPISRDR
jgi:hypothetical protein